MLFGKLIRNINYRENIRGNLTHVNIFGSFCIKIATIWYYRLPFSYRIPDSMTHA